MRARYASGAKADLRLIVSYIAMRNPDAARRLRHEIDRVANDLARYPQRGRLLRDTDLGPLRRIVVSPFIVLYTFQSGIVTIVRVLHGARDLETLLDEIFPARDP